MTTVEVLCPSCLRALDPGYRFCPVCGVAADVPENPTAIQDASAPQVVPTAVATDRGTDAASILLPADRARDTPPGAYLKGGASFCRSCGADCDGAALSCPACGHGTGPLPPRIEGAIGKAYYFRRNLRMRQYVVVRQKDDVVELLSEQGELAPLHLTQLPEKSSTSHVPKEFAPGMRTPSGELLRVATAATTGVVKKTWDGLVEAALAAVGDETAARLFALDALALNRIDVLEQLPLTEPERSWLLALDAATKDDAERTLKYVAALPVNGYRPKLGLILRVADKAKALGLNMGPIEPQLVAYLEQEPIANLLYDALVLSGRPEATSDAAGRLSHSIATSRSVMDQVDLPHGLAGELAAGLDALAGDVVRVPDSVSFVSTNVRAVLSLSQPGLGLVRPEDIDRLPLAVVDDLIDAGSVAQQVALTGSADPDRVRYLTARLSPERLTDAEVDDLDHEEERVRRAFRRGDLETLTQLEDSAVVRHYRALLALRNSKLDQVEIEAVHPEARPIVDDVVTLISAKADGAPIYEKLTDTILDDPTVWQVVVEISGSTELDPSPDLQARFPAFTEWLALHQAREHLFLGNWQAAVAAADHCLDLAKGEVVRDEAQNLKACGLSYLGNDAAAIATLEEAIEGAYSESLLANIGIVAAGLQPEVAARHLGRLIAEAPTTAMRVAAARRAVAIWQNSNPETWSNSDESPLPDAFQDSLRDLVAGPIDIDAFREFASILAINDSAWFANAGNLAASPHWNTPEARFYVARAADLDTMIDVMSAEMARGPVPDWMIRERDSLRNIALESLLANLDEPNAWFGNLALSMATKGVLANEYDYLLFSCLGTATLTYYLSQREEEIADRFITSIQDVRRRWQALDSTDRESLEPMVELATRRLVINRMNARQRDVNNAIDLFNGAMDLGRRAEGGSPAMYEAMRRVEMAAGIARNARNELIPWVPIIDHESVHNDLNQTIEWTRDVERQCLDVLR